jgi:hypothetical protein
MKRLRAISWTVIAASCLACACAPPAAKPTPDAAAATGGAGLAIAQAQAAVDEWINGPAGPSRDGSAVVLGVTAMKGGDYAAADLRVKKFPDEDGHTSPSEDPAAAIFARQSDGAWVLTSVAWDAGRRTAAPDVPVR